MKILYLKKTGNKHLKINGIVEVRTHMPLLSPVSSVETLYILLIAFIRAFVKKISA